MDVFHIEQGIVKPTPEILMISPFKEIWARDKTVKKEKALKEFAYIEFFVSYKKSNPFCGFPPQDRHRKICETVLHNISYIPDELVKQGMDVYKDWQENASPSLRFYKSVVKANEKLVTFAETIDLNERDVKGSAVYKPNDITSITSKAYENLKTLTLMKEKVEQELFEASKTRSNRTINVFEIRPEERSQKW
jgi:hypothetical protein